MNHNCNYCYIIQELEKDIRKKLEKRLFNKYLGVYKDYNLPIKDMSEFLYSVNHYINNPFIEGREKQKYRKTINKSSEDISNIYTTDLNSEFDKKELARTILRILELANIILRILRNYKKFLNRDLFEEMCTELLESYSKGKNYKYLEYLLEYCK